MNNATPTVITEADVLAFFNNAKQTNAAQFPFLDSLHFGINIGCDKFQVGGFDRNSNYITGYGASLDGAMADLRAKVGTPETKAAKLREQAAKLIAEANEIQGIATPVVVDGPAGCAGTNGVEG